MLSTGHLYVPCAEFLYMGDSNRRLREVRVAAGFDSARKAALRFNWPVSTYASHENGQTPVPTEKAKIYAKAFKTSPAYILTGENTPKGRTTELAGRVGAAQDIHPIPEDPAIDREIDTPPVVTGEAVAVIVRGNSMWPRYFDGEHIYYSNEHRPPQELVGRECVVRLADGRMLVKILRAGSRKGRFTLESWNAPPLEDQKVEWAAPVRWRG